MTEVDERCALSVSADEAWTVLADFGAFLDWAGAPGATAKITGEGPGMVRLLNIPDLGTIGERLENLDAASKVLSYSLVEGKPLGMQTYSARVQVVDLGPSSCELKWHGVFDAAPGFDAKEVGANLATSYQGMSGALEAFVKAR